MAQHAKPLDELVTNGINKHTAYRTLWGLPRPAHARLKTIGQVNRITLQPWLDRVRPEIGDRVTILKGMRAGQSGTLIGIDESAEIPLKVETHNGYRWYSPDEVTL